MTRLFSRVTLAAMLLPPLAAQDDRWGQIDQLNDDKMFDAEHELLSEMSTLHAGDVAYLWRMSRHHFTLSDNSEDAQVISRNIYSGLDFARLALAADSTSAQAHGFYGILIGRAGEIEGTKQKIVNSYEVAAHTLKAIELGGEDDAWQHVMGRWHFALSDLSWLERTFASIIYATPPEASFEEAEDYFMEAARMAPEDIRHYLWLGKTRIALNNSQGARSSLESALALPAKSDSDNLLQAEAQTLLGGL